MISILALRRVNIGIFEGLEYYLLGSYIGMNLKEKLAYRSKAVTVISACYVVFYLIRGFRTSNVVMISLFCISLWFVLDKFVHEDNLPWWMQLTFFTYVAHDMLLEAFEKYFCGGWLESGSCIIGLSIYANDCNVGINRGSIWLEK